MARDGAAGWVAILPPRWRASIDRPLALAIQVGALSAAVHVKRGDCCFQGVCLPGQSPLPEGGPTGTQFPGGFF